MTLFNIRPLQGSQLSEYVHDHMDSAIQNDFYFFTSFFYTRWKETAASVSGKRHDPHADAARHKLIQKWTRGVHLLQKKYLVFPIHESAHWSLAIVCFPGGKGSRILHFDSLSLGRARTVAAQLSVYINAERKQDPDCRIATIPFVEVKVPQQTNGSDCGLYLLRFVEKFLEAPVTDLRTSRLHRPLWFMEADIKDLRERMKRNIEYEEDKSSIEGGTDTDLHEHLLDDEKSKNPPCLLCVPPAAPKHPFCAVCDHRVTLQSSRAFNHHGSSTLTAIRSRLEDPTWLPPDSAHVRVCRKCHCVLALPHPAHQPPSFKRPAPPLRRLATQGFVFTRADVELTKAAEAFIAYAILAHPTEISGGFLQTENLSASPSGSRYLELLWPFLCRFLIDTEGLDASFYKLTQLKLLVAPPNSGPQPLHRDGTTKNDYVIAFYVTDDEEYRHRSTEFSSFYHQGFLSKEYAIINECREQEGLQQKYVVTRSERQGMADAQAVLSRGWDPSQLEGRDVKLGDMCVFAVDAIHRGPHNATPIDRKVIFCVLSDSNEAYDDEYQHFEWSTMEDAYEFESEETRAAVVKWKDFHPAEHESDPIKKAKMLEWIEHAAPSSPTY